MKFESAVRNNEGIQRYEIDADASISGREIFKNT